MTASAVPRATPYARLAADFEAGAIDAKDFGHGDHVGVAYEMLRRYDFAVAAGKYAEGIKALAAKAGRPEKYHATITFAFLSLIAERMHTTPHSDYDGFIAGNGDLLSREALQDRYSSPRLNSDLARRIFLLPDAIPADARAKRRQRGR